jgi:glycosyltransferase involved in cell wall biosynthesis
MDYRSKRSDRLRVLIVSNGHPCPGVPHFYTFIAEQAKAISRNADVKIIVPVEKHIPIARHIEHLDFSRKFPPLLRGDDYVTYFPRVYRYFPKFNKYLADYLALWATLYTIWRRGIRFDIVHGHFAHPAGFIAASLSRLFRKPYVLTVHGSDVFEVFVEAETVKTRRAHRDFGLRKAHRVICVSNSLRERVVSLGVPFDRTVVIPNGVDTAKFSPLPEGSGDNSILFVGNLIERKGIDLLIEAFKRVSPRHPGLRLKLLGDGPVRERLKEQTLRSGIADRVEFLPQRPNSEIPQIMAKARLFCLPSREEGFGVVLIEALASGVPVIGARTGGIPEIVTSEEFGVLFEPGNVIEMEAKLHYALERYWDKAAIREAGLKYSWGRVAERIVDQYHLVLN